MKRLMALALILFGSIVGGYYLLRQTPAFDLDGFSAMVDRLQAAHTVARRVADTDAIPDWMHTDRQHLETVGRILATPEEDCAKTVEALEAQLRAYEAQQEEEDRRLDMEALEALPAAQRNQIGQKLIVVLAPAYRAIEAPVGKWAWQCKEESRILDEVLGTLAAD